MDFTTGEIMRSADRKLVAPLIKGLKPHILYIMSVSHSGSTLLDLLVSGHSQALSVGEAKRFSPTNSLRMSCTCQVKLVWDCPFWRQVDSTLQRSSSLTLRTLDLCGGDDRVFVDHNRAFYAAVGQVTGRVDALDAGPPELVHHDLVRIIKVAAQLLWKLGPGIRADLYEYAVELELVGALVGPVQLYSVQAVAAH